MYGDETDKVRLDLHFIIYFAGIKSPNETHVIKYEIHDIGDVTWVFCPFDG
jgi:hypothetical protein